MKGSGLIRRTEHNPGPSLATCNATPLLSSSQATACLGPGAVSPGPALLVRFPRSLRKNSRDPHGREGYEFHSCRNWRVIDNGFQPLGECRDRKTLFPQPPRLLSKVPGIIRKIVRNIVPNLVPKLATSQLASHSYLISLERQSCLGATRSYSHE